jgi:SAM-dependent methyltransferase
LEVGVGTGRFAAALGIREGVDPADSALAMARQRGIDTRQGVAERLPYDDATFDGILLVVAICFLRDPASALREFRRVLRPQGRLVIGMIPREGAWGLYYAEQGRRGHPFYSTARFFSPQEVSSLAEREGFVFDRACSSLFSAPEEPPIPDRRSGIVAEAGFVCLGFTMAPKSVDMNPVVVLDEDASLSENSAKTTATTDPKSEYRPR